MLYLIIADGNLDQICETEEQAKKEQKDLKAMGCSVRIKKAKDWQEADEIEEKMRGY